MPLFIDTLLIRAINFHSKIIMLNKYAFALELSSDDDLDEIKPSTVTQVSTIPITNW